MLECYTPQPNPKRKRNRNRYRKNRGASSCYTLPPKACVEDFTNHLPIPLHHELNDYLDYSLLTSQLPDFSADEIDEDESLHKLPVLSASMLEDRTPSPSPVMSNVVNKICGRFCEPLDPMDFEELDEEIYGRFCERKMQPPIISKISDLPPEVQGPTYVSRSKADRISGLPEEIRGHILSFLPTKQAVATSLLNKRWTNLWKIDEDGASSSCYTLPPKACVEDFRNHLPIPLHHELNDYLDYSLLTSQLPDFSADEIDEDESLHKLPVLSASMLEDRTPSPSPVMSNVVNKICGRFCEPLDPMDFEELVASHVNADIALPSHSSRLVGIGIENIGNTCFMAAILQCLTHTGSHHTPCHVSGFCFICAFREHNNQALELSRDTIYPTRFLQNVNHFSAAFIPYAQGDEHEFMICALKKLKDALPKVEDNLIEQIFGGKTVSKVRCCSCGFSSDTTGPIFDLALAVENVSTVQSALESYITVENMDGMFKCSSCDQEVYMEKQLLIDKAPEIAVLQLKRFKSDGEKIQSQVDFPMNLDVAPYTSPKGREHDAILMYDLYAVVVHRGSTAKSGHYFSYVRSDEDKWHLMNDSNVFSVSEEDVLTQQAYLLFYAKHGPPWFSSVVKSEEKNLKPKSIDNTQDFGNGLLYGIDMEEEDVKIGGCR